MFTYLPCQFQKSELQLLDEPEYIETSFEWHGYWNGIPSTIVAPEDADSSPTATTTTTEQSGDVTRTIARKPHEIEQPKLIAHLLQPRTLVVLQVRVAKVEDLG